MKHIFVINPVAGRGDSAEALSAGINELFKGRGEPFEIHLTTGVGEAAEFVKKACAGAAEHLRFYACGGDGTLNEVASGISGVKDVSFTSLPCGSGNDFVRNFGTAADFYRIDKLADCAAPREIDIIRFGDGGLCVNMCNVGFDATVALNMCKFKRLPFVSGKMAYNISLVYCLLHKMSSKLTITLDGGEVLEGEFLLAALGNGCYCGGGYKSNPLAETDDGMLDLCVVKKVPRLKLLGLIKSYKLGEHLSNPKFIGYIIYHRCRSIEVKADAPFAISVDGEIRRDKNLAAQVERAALRFALPYNAAVSVTEQMESGCGAAVL